MRMRIKFDKDPTEDRLTLIIYAALGVLLIVLVCALPGCGDVTVMTDDGGVAGGGGGGAGGDGGSAGHVTVMADGGAGSGGATGGVGGAAGTGGSTGGASGTTGAGGSAGTGGSPGRPLGAGCVSDSQCGSNICDGASHACCNGKADVCNACVGGYLTPVTDGTTCGTPLACVGTDRTWHACSAGGCVQKIVQCAKAICHKDGTPIQGCLQGGCDLGDDPCYCYAGTSGNISYPCP